MDRRILRVAGSLALAASIALAADVTIRRIAFTSEDQSTRVVIESSGKLTYHAARLRDPDRIYFDLQGTGPAAAARVIPADGKLLKQIRQSDRGPGVTRVVLDVAPGVEFTVSRLTGPDRLVIELRPGSVAAAPPVQPVATPAPAPAAPEPVASPRPVATPALAAAAPEPAKPEPAATPAPTAPEPVAPPVTAAPEPVAQASTPAAAGPVVVEEIVAKVNNEIVTRGEMDRFRRMIQGEIAHQRLSPDNAAAMLKQAETDLLRDRIDQLLLVQKGNELDIKVDQDVSKQVAQLQLKSGIVDPDKFQEWVREQSGMSFEDYKQQMKDGLLTSEVIRREVGGRISISAAEAHKYYDEHKNEFVREEQVWLQEILISTEGKDAKGVEAAEKKAKDLVSRARKGENFSTLARDNSDAETADNGGNLPAFKRGMLKKEIEDVAFRESKGYVTDPYRQPNGFLILKVVQHDAAGLQPFDAVENDIMEKLYQPRMQPAVRAYLTKLRQEAFLQIKPGYVDSGAAPGKDATWQEAAKLKPQQVTLRELAERTRKKRLLFVLPVPGTEKKVAIPKHDDTTIPVKTEASASQPAPADK